MLRETFRTSCWWQGPQEMGAARRSPGFMNRTNATSSSRSSVYVRSGLAEVLKRSAFFGRTCAFSIVRAAPSPP
jgi:hypothetical protein